MRLILICMTFVFWVGQSFGQHKKNIQKSWIKTSIENLSEKVVAPDTLYTRYTFNKSTLNISFYPGWDDFKQTWSIANNKLTIGYDTYTIETLTDSTLTITLDGFRRMKFMSEDYLSNQDKHLVLLGEHNGRPYYKANHYITPRYTGKTAFRDFLQKNVEGYNIKMASYFRLTFIVTENGAIENVKIINSITEGFDKEITKQLMKTSKDWKPATFQGKPIQTEMFYDIKYLNSLTPFNLGALE